MVSILTLTAWGHLRFLTMRPCPEDKDRYCFMSSHLLDCSGWHSIVVVIVVVVYIVDLQRHTGVGHFLLQKMLTLQHSGAQTCCGDSMGQHV